MITCEENAEISQQCFTWIKLLYMDKNLSYKQFTFNNFNVSIIQEQYIRNILIFWNKLKSY